MARRKSGSRKRANTTSTGTKEQKSKRPRVANVAKRKRGSASSQTDQKSRVFDALNLYRQGRAKSVSAAARDAGTKLRKMWELVPRAIAKNRSGGRLRIKATDPYSAKVEILTNTGALVVTARGSRQRQLAGQHRAAYFDVVEGKKRPSALDEFRGKKVGGHELISDYGRLVMLAKAGVLGQLETLYVSAGGR